MEFFKESEFSCNCGECSKGFKDMDENSLALLFMARSIAKTPFSLTSAIRCKKWNEIEGGGEDSSHLTGFAFDIFTPNSRARFKILSALLDAGFKRIGIGKDFIHADHDINKPAKVMWPY
jgi:zinc D-Ala-D-Ala carboxypeptidase